MKTTIQSGMHPDAEILNAFAEQLLPAPEREQILAHMATCSRCREVLFLVQRAAAEEQPEAAPVVARVKEARRSWFAGWRLAWVPVAALAGFVGFAVLQHYRHAAPETQMAGNVSQSRAEQKPEAAQAPAVAEKQVQPVRERQTEARSKTPAREAAKPQKDAGRSLDDVKQISQRDEKLGATGTLAKTEGAAAGGSIHGASTSRANGVSIGGPMANQLQQQNANQFQEQNAAPQQNALQLTRNNELASANRPMAKAAPGAASEAVTVQAEPKPVAAPPPAIQQLSLSTMATQSVAVDKLAKKAKPVLLPSGLTALSSASVAKRTIAIDPTGALFLSEDNGKHWQAIQTQWSGRAVLVRAQQSANQPAVLAGARPAPFELVTDKLQTWVSEDGKSWTAETVGPK
jgi:hypothetical protein